MSNKRRRIASGALKKDLAVAYSKVITIEGVPDECTLDSLQGIIDTISVGPAPTKITWYITEDLAGDYPITDEIEETIVVGQTTATDGGIRTTFDAFEYSRSTDGVQGSLYVWAKTDAGTCNLNVRLRYVDGD